MTAKELNLDLDTIAEKFVSLTQDEWFAKDEIEHIRLALTELEEIKGKQEHILDEVAHIVNFVEVLKFNRDMPSNALHSLNVIKESAQKIDFIIKGEGK